MENYKLYPWPEYKELMDKDGFKDNSYYCPDEDAYFISENWLNKNKSILFNISDKYFATESQAKDFKDKNNLPDEIKVVHGFDIVYIVTDSFDVNHYFTDWNKMNNCVNNNPYSKVDFRFTE